MIIKSIKVLLANVENKFGQIDTFKELEKDTNLMSIFMFADAQIDQKPIKLYRKKKHFENLIHHATLSV